MKTLLSFIISFCFGQLLIAQDALDIRIKAENYESDSLLIGYYYADKQLALDTLLKAGDSKFEWKQDSLATPGLYMLVTFPEKQFVQFILPPDDQKFNIEINPINLANAKFKGSNINEVFTEYMAFLAEQRIKVDRIKNKASTNPADSTTILKYDEQLADLDKEVEDYVNKIIEADPTSIVALLLQANKSIDIPTFEGSEEEKQLKKYLYYKTHYFDFVDTKHEAILRTPVLDKRVKYYMEKLTVQHPDSLINSLDTILSLFEEDSEAYRYYLSNYLNSYAKSKIVGMDAVYVHIVDNYYSQGKAPWAEEELLLKFQDEANMLRRVLIGTQADDLLLYLEDNSSLKISEIDYEYLVLLFWAPDCGHCKKIMPDIVQFERDYRDKGVKVLAVCSKHKEKTKTCWEDIPKKDMVDFINVADEFHRSRFKLKYNVKSTPKIFILDADRKIIVKNIGAEYLSAFMDEQLKATEESAN